MALTAKGPLAPGARVGAFVVCDEIGYGATSVVYEAEHRSMRHRVAVKVLRASSNMDQELRRRFDREKRLCARLASVHVPHVYDVGELPSGLPYIVMERLNGATLADWLTDERKFAMPLAVEIGVQLCSALGAVHDAGTLHRDVKPENIVLHRERGDGYVLKLFDFGICKPEVDDGPALTQRGTVVGTPEYMSPEQVQGRDLDARTDVYSTGVLLYELLAGRTPYEGSDIDNVGRMILTGDPPRLRDLCSECPIALETIVMRAMAKSKKARYASMDALRKELERFRDEHGLKRQPRVWSLLPANGPGRVHPLLPPQSASEREYDDSPIPVDLPMARSGIVTSAAVGLAVFAACLFSVGYYAYEPEIAAAVSGTDRTNVERTAVIEAPAPVREQPLPIPRRVEDTPFMAPPPPVLRPPQPPVIAAPQPVPVEAPTLVAEAEEEDPAAERRRRRARWRRAHPEREEAPVTTIAVAPTQWPQEAHELQQPQRPQQPQAPHAPGISSADLMAQVGVPRAPDHVPAPRPPLPRSNELPRSPYDETPANPF